MNIQSVKQRFGVVGNNERLERAIETALRVAPTDLSVLVTGESGVGKETIPQIIHHYSARKHNKYIAVNCGAIPEGTMDSELFGHVKGSFTGATSERKGYFEEADGGTIFLDEVAEMPIQTQVKLLRLLEAGEFIKVGSSKILKTNVRIIAATNVNIAEAIEKGKFREDLFYRLNTVPVTLPPLRKRKEDIFLLFRKFAADFAEKYRMPVVRLSDDAVEVLSNYYWHGNIRQLKNITEQLSIIEQQRQIDASLLLRYLPDFTENKLPVLYKDQNENLSEREILYKVLFDMRKEMNDLKKIVSNIVQENTASTATSTDITDINDILPVENVNKNTDSLQTIENWTYDTNSSSTPVKATITDANDDFLLHEEIEESLSLEEKEKELIVKALDKHRGKRKHAAKDLGISERTLYRKIKEYNLK